MEMGTDSDRLYELKRIYYYMLKRDAIVDMIEQVENSNSYNIDLYYVNKYSNHIMFYTSVWAKKEI